MRLALIWLKENKNQFLAPLVHNVLQSIAVWRLRVCISITATAGLHPIQYKTLDCSATRLQSRAAALSAVTSPSLHAAWPNNEDCCSCH